MKKNKSPEETRKLGLVAAKVTKEVRKRFARGDLSLLNKASVIEFAGQLLAKKGLVADVATDNWLFPKKAEASEMAEEALMPDISAAIVLSQRDMEKNILKVAIGLVSPWDSDALVADVAGGYLLRNNRLFLIKKIDGAYLETPPRVFIFGQKGAEKYHWTYAGLLIVELNDKLTRTQDDMGPHYLVSSWCVGARISGNHATLVPRNTICSEPYCNNSKNEAAIWALEVTNKNLPQNQRFQILDMSGQEVFVDGHMHTVGGACKSYCAEGYIAGPRKESIYDVLRQLKIASEKVIPDPERTNKKVEKLRKDLQQFEG